MIPYRIPFLAFSALALLTGCTAWEGLQQDARSGLTALRTAFDTGEAEGEDGAGATGEAMCPAVSVRPDLAALSDFADPANPDASTLVSKARVTQIRAVCTMEGEEIALHLDMDMLITLGPEGRSEAGETPSFAYPYFVAVTDQDGNVISKELFALSATFEAGEEEIERTENIVQILPAEQEGTTYSVIAGYQLTEDQLAYNQAAMNAQ